MESGMESRGDPRRLTERTRGILARVVRDHQASVRAFLCRFVSDPDVVEEALQEVFVAAVPHCDELAEMSEERARAYLHGIARNLVRKRWKSEELDQDRWKRSIDQIVRNEMERRLAGETGDELLRIQALRSCMEALPQESMSLVQEHYFGEASFAELEGRLRRSAATLRMSLFRVRQRLRACIEKALRAEEPA